MSFRRTAFAVALLSAVAASQGVGDRLAPPTLEGFAQIGATSTADLAGRAVLYEFFAYW